MVDVNSKFSRADQLLMLLQERSSRFCAGEKFLSVRQIMDEFNVSQITVKQAMERLCEAGMLEAQDRRGYFVRRTRRFGKIAALVPDGGERDYQDDFRESFFREVGTAGFEGEVFTYTGSEEAIAMLPTLKADAILFRPYSHETVTAPWLNRIMSVPVPVILVHATVPIENCRFVDSDNEFCGLLGATHFMINGHRKLAVLLSEPDLPSIRQRVNGFVKCMEAYKLEVEILDPGIRLGECSKTKSREFMREYLRRCPKPDFTGLFVTSEVPSQEVYRVLTAHGLSVPEDISLISLGHSLHRSGVNITAINTRRDQVIRHAVEIVQRHFEDGAAFYEQCRIVPEINSGVTVKKLNCPST